MSKELKAHDFAGIVDHESGAIRKKKTNIKKFWKFVYHAPDV